MWLDGPIITFWEILTFTFAAISMSLAFYRWDRYSTLGGVSTYPLDMLCCGVQAEGNVCDTDMAVVVTDDIYRGNATNGVGAAASAVVDMEVRGTVDNPEAKPITMEAKEATAIHCGSTSPASVIPYAEIVSVDL